MVLPRYALKGNFSGALANFASFKLNSLSATVVLTNAGAPVNGTSGTGAGVAGPGSLLIDTTNAVLYLNTNTLASPTWSSQGGSSIEQQTVVTGITASATQTLAGATALTARINRVNTSAASGNAVKLAALLPGQSQTIYNDGANPIKVFPAAAGVTIDGGSAGASVTLTNALRAVFTCTATNVVISAQLGAVSA